MKHLCNKENAPHLKDEPEPDFITNSLSQTYP